MTRSEFRRIWLAPLVIAIVSLAGLISALLGDGIEDAVSWVGLGVPVVVIVWARLRRKA